MKEHRHIIDVVGNNPQRKLIVVGGMHGNEISGITAIQNILARVKESFNNTGTIYFLKGNIDAINASERFLEMDLNRLWVDKYLNKPSSIADVSSLLALHTLIADTICEGKFDNCTFLDLHTFSAKSGIFCIPAGNDKSVQMAQSFGVPFIEKLSDMLPGTALSYFGKKGMTSVVFEGGTHDSDQAVRNLEAAIWHALAYNKLIDNQLDIVTESRDLLEKISQEYPHHLELIYRHKLDNYQAFQMRKGYYNFKPVSKSEPLAIQDQEEVFSPDKGYMLMPLYQKKGSDGFFIVKEKDPEYV